MNLLLCVFALPLCVFAPFQEERLDDVEFEKNFAVHVKVLTAMEKNWRGDPAGSLKLLEPTLKAVETDLAPRFPRHVDARLLVRLTRGIDKGETREYPFHPYRLAGEMALAAGMPERAAGYFKKSPSSASLLADAQKAVAAKEKKDPVPPPPPRPEMDLRPFLDSNNFTGALEALRAAKDKLGADYEKKTAEVIVQALSFQKARVSAFAGVLPRLMERDFRKDHLEPCLKSCARIPPGSETDELRWIRRLDAWLEKRDPSELDRLAIAAVKFGTDFHVVCDRAQEERLQQIERGVDAILQAPRSERPRLLDELGRLRSVFEELLAARDRADLRERLARSQSRLPVDEQVLKEAREAAMTIADIRRLSGELERLWDSPRRARMSVPDQKELALFLGLYRCCALFLDGRTVEETAKDPRVAEVFRATDVPLPEGVPPKVAEVRKRIP